MALPRIFCGVPTLPHVHLEIAKAIETLPSNDRYLGQHDGLAKSQSHRELIAEIARDAWRILRKTGYNPNEPRVPADNADGDNGPTGTRTPFLAIQTAPQIMPRIAVQNLTISTSPTIRPA